MLADNVYGEVDTPAAARTSPKRGASGRSSQYTVTSPKQQQQQQQQQHGRGAVMRKGSDHVYGELTDAADAPSSVYGEVDGPQQQGFYEEPDREESAQDIYEAVINSSPRKPTSNGTPTTTHASVRLCVCVCLCVCVSVCALSTP